MNNSHKTFSIEKRKSENFLVYATVFWGMMSFFYHFQYLSGGGFGPFLNSIHFSVCGVVFLNLLYFSKGNSILYTKGTNNSIVIVFSICATLYVLIGAQWVTAFGILGDICTMVLIMQFVLLRDDLKLRICDTFMKAMAILMALSIIEYLVYLFVGLRCVLFDNIMYLEERPMVQTIFNLMYPYSPYSVIGISGYYRFQSLADEPGGVGTIMGFLLFVTVGNPKYKREYMVFWIAGILSFSLAFYIIALFHLIASAKNKSNWYYFMLFAIIAVLAYRFLGEIFDSLIVGRVSGNNISEIDNRTSEQLNKDLARAVSDDSIFFGHEIVAETGAKGVLYNRGLIGMLSLVIAYSYSFIRKTKSMKLHDATFPMMFLIVFWISYYQRSSILMFQYVIPFFCIPVMLKYKETVRLRKTYEKQ